MTFEIKGIKILENSDYIESHRYISSYFDNYSDIYWDINYKNKEEEKNLP